MDGQGARLFLVLLAVAALALPVMAQEDTNIAAQVFNQAADSVVAIGVITAVDPSTGRPSGGAGSGFVIDQQGHILTNNHVVEAATEIEVTFRDGTLARGEVVGLDPDSDLAVVQVDVSQETLKPITFADSNALFVGQPVFAIGSPFGERWTLTTGIISALQRTIPGLEQFSIGGVIQTDAAINPGNSGGPLLDDQARVVGVNAQIATTSQSSSGVGFAIPANLARRVAQDLIEYGVVEYSYIGIGGGNVSLSVVEDLNLPNNTQGIVVTSVTPGGPAEEAGLRALETEQNEEDITIKAADIITAVNGQPLRSLEELINYLAENTVPGDQITVDVLRASIDNGTERLQLQISLAPRP
jgi:S1-C subfamily serine protease